jgi:hypothetical protein
MVMQESWNDVGGGLAGLSAHDADPERVERIRVRCLATLTAQRRRAEARSAGRARWGGWIEPTFALGCGAAYLAAAVVVSVELAAAVRGVLTLMR